MVDFIDRKEGIKRYFPAPFYNLVEGRGLSIILEVIGTELNLLDADVANYREQFLLEKALQKYLSIHGIQRDVFKPLGTKMIDASYRELIKVVTNSSKNIEYIFERLLKIFFGSTVFSNKLAEIYSYQNNEIVLELKKSALVVAAMRDLLGTTYIHRSPANPFDGNSLDLWSSSILTGVVSGSTSVQLSSIPPGIPLEGILSFGTSDLEVKLFTRVGAVITFLSPIENDYVAGFVVQGPKFPDDYPSAYMYDGSLESDLVGSYSPGATVLSTGVSTLKFPAQGTVEIGNSASATFEAKGFTRSGTTLTLDGPISFVHSSGEKIACPTFVRKIKTTLTAGISQGASQQYIFVTNGADFPLHRGALRIERSYPNEETIPFVGRVVGDNTKLEIDPTYVFKKAHLSGETVHLMALQTRLSKFGDSYPFYLNDTAKVRDQFLALLNRVKVTGVRLKVVLL